MEEGEASLYSRAPGGEGVWGLQAPCSMRHETEDGQADQGARPLAMLSTQ